MINTGTSDDHGREKCPEVHRVTGLGGEGRRRLTQHVDFSEVVVSGLVNRTITISMIKVES